MPFSALIRGESSLIKEESVIGIGESLQGFRILENSEILEIPPVKDTFGNGP